MHFLAAVVTTEQTGLISTALSTAIENVLDTFISLLPIMALAVGVAFTIKFVRGLFNQTKNGR